MKMIESLFSGWMGNKIADEDITDVWNHCHPHLYPYDTHLASEQKKQLPIIANLRFGGKTWVNMVGLTFDQVKRRFTLTAENRQAILEAHPEIAATKVDAVDARLWFAKPTMINIEPTTRCNFKCWYCVGRHMKQDDIDIDNFASMLDNFPELKTIALVGEGEPLLHKDFFKMAGMAKDRGIRVMIISNGSAFSQSVIRQLCETEVAYVSISIDSYDEETFADSRIEGKLGKIWQGIRNLRDYRDSNGFSYPKISLKGTLFENTKDQLPGIVDKAQENGVEIFESFQPLNPMRNYVHIYPKEKLGELGNIETVQSRIDLDSQYANKKLQPFKEFCRDENIELYSAVNTNHLVKNCNETWIYSLLSGDITPCCQIKNPPSPNWNIFKEDIKKIMADTEYENMRFNLWNGIFPEYCAGCWKTR